MERQRFSRRNFLIGAGGVAGMSLLAGCVAPSAPDAAPADSSSADMPASDSVVEFEYWHRRSGDTALLYEDLAAEFNEMYGDEMHVTAIYQGSIQEVNQKVRAAAAGGGLPGALMADDYDVTQFTFSNILVDLTPYVEHSDYGFTQEEIDDILPNQWNRHKLPLYDNRMMALTQGFSCFTTYWNVDATSQVGMERPPENWDAFPDYAREISEANEGSPAWLISGAGDRFISTLLTYGVAWLKDNNEESNFDAPEALEIMTWWRELSDEGLLGVTGDARDLYMAYENLHYMDSSGNSARFHAGIDNFQWGAGMPPQRHNGEPITETYGPVNTVPATDADKQMAGWRWIKWQLEPEVHARYIQQTAYFPSTLSAAQTTLLQETYADNQILFNLFENVAPQAQILAPNPALPEVRGQITANVVNEVLLQQLTPEEGVRKLKAEADEAIRNAML